MPFRDFELREWIGDALDFDVAARGDVYGAAQRFGKFAENLGHLHRRLEIKLVSLEFHAIRVSWSCRSGCRAALPGRERPRDGGNDNRWWRRAGYRSLSKGGPVHG